MVRPVAWVLGQGGLLGTSTAWALSVECELWRQDGQLSWEHPVVKTQIKRAVARFAEFAAGRQWRVAWCAGTGVTSSERETLDFESAVLQYLLGELGATIEAGHLSRGVFFFASSAGGVYAGSDGPPFDEDTPARSLSPYGTAKLEQEGLVHSWAEEFRVPSLVGRISNLYGPGQNLAKRQGLVSQLCWSQILRRPLNIYVPLATMRDYIYSPDCGSMIASALETLSGEPEHARQATIKVIASHRPLSIGAVLGEFRRVIRRNPLVSLRASPLGRHQILDLRLTSNSPIDVERRATTPFPVGLHATFHDLQRRYAASRG